MSETERIDQGREEVVLTPADVGEIPTDLIALIGEGQDARDNGEVESLEDVKEKVAEGPVDDPNDPVDDYGSAEPLVNSIGEIVEPWAEHVGDELVEIAPEYDEAIPFTPMEGATVGRDTHGALWGDTPIKYRMVFEFDPPIRANKKAQDPVTGEMTNDIRRIELFGSSEMSFYLAEIALSRMLVDPSQMKRMEAVILTEDSRVLWHDRNPNEAE